MKEILQQIKVSLLAVLALVVILGGLYPLTVWLVAQGIFPDKANGSLIRSEGRATGAGLIGQDFSGRAYFHPRPSAAGRGYDALRSGGSNLGPTSAELMDTIRARVAAYRAENDIPSFLPVPADAVTASASGLDPHISPANAYLQAGRVARARGLTETAVRRKIKGLIEGRTFGVLGEPRLNVLALNMELDRMAADGR